MCRVNVPFEEGLARIYNAALTSNGHVCLTERESRSSSASGHKVEEKDYLILQICTSASAIKLSQTAGQQAALQLPGQPAIVLSNPAGGLTREPSARRVSRVAGRQSCNCPNDKKINWFLFLIV